MLSPKTMWILTAYFMPKILRQNRLLKTNFTINFILYKNNFLKFSLQFQWVYLSEININNPIHLELVVIHISTHKYFIIICVYRLGLLLYSASEFI